MFKVEKNVLRESKYIANVLSLILIENVFIIDDNNGFGDDNDDVCLEASDCRLKAAYLKVRCFHYIFMKIFHFFFF